MRSEEHGGAAAHGLIRRPGADQIRELAAMEDMQPTDDEVAEIEALLDEALAMFDRLDELPQPAFPTAYRERDPGRRLCPRRTRTTPSPPLPGSRAADRQACRQDRRPQGQHPARGRAHDQRPRLLEHYVPDVDAVVVERLLDAGAVIVGKLNMDDMGFAGTSETSAFGVVRNPRNPAFSAGVPRAAAAPRSRPARSTSPSRSIRAAADAFPPPGAGWSRSSRPTASCPASASRTSTTPSTSSARWRARWPRWRRRSR